MARQNQIDREPFTVAVDWHAEPVTGGDRVLDASVGRLEMSVDDATVTEYRSDKGDTGTSLAIPLYGMAEWVAESWWSLLYEPRKTEDAEHDVEFRSRHWLGFARDGMALPDLWFLPAGDKIELVAHEAYLRFARLTFQRSIDGAAPVDLVKAQLGNFVDAVLARMTVLGVTGTEAHEAWTAVRNTRPEQERYCRLIGSLGLSPYEEHEKIDDILESLDGVVSDRVLADLFQASSGDALERTSQTARELVKALPDTPPIDLTPLEEAGLPLDHSPQAYRWGLDAAKKARAQLGISEYEPSGGVEFFKALGLDSNWPPAAAGAIDAGAVTASVGKHDLEAHIAVVDGELPQRRFAVARSAFIGWASPPESARLVTAARTREQQASRSFAAEMLAPIGYIKRQAPDMISSFGIERIARQLDVSPRVVQYQVQNNKLGYVNY